MAAQQAESGQQNVTVRQVAGGCVGAIVVMTVLGIWIAGMVRRSNEIDKIALTQATAMMEQILDESNGQQDATDLILAQPAGSRRDHAGQLVDYWISSGQPALHPTEGVSDEWLGRDSARRVVKDEMVVLLMKWTTNKP